MSLEEIFKEIEQSILLKTFSLPNLNAPSLYEWDDAQLAKLREPLHFHYSAYQRPNLKLILFRFYNLYLKGIVKEEDKIASVVFDMVALSETSKCRIWTNETEGVVGFYHQNQSQDIKLSDLVAGPLSGEVIFNPNWTKAETGQYMNLMASYFPESQKNFDNFVVKIIDQINPVGPVTKEETSLIRLSSFLAMTLLKFATKNKDQMGKAFLKNQYKNKLTFITMWDAEYPFSPPCIRCLELCEHALKTGLRTTGQIFCILAHEYVIAKQKNDSHVLNFLCASVLTDTAKYGLGMIQMLDRVCKITTKSRLEISKLTFWSTTTETWTILSDFLETQCSIDNEQYGFNWARIIDHRYFRKLTPKENPFLATVFAAVLEQVQGPGVWNAEWAKVRSNIPAAKKLGLALYNMTRPGAMERATLSSSQEVLEEARRMQRAHEVQDDYLEEANANWD